MRALRELLTKPRSQVTLDTAALELATIEHPGLDPEPHLRQLDDLAFNIAERAGDLNDGVRFIRITNAYLFDELEFRGNEGDYYNPRNSCLNDVLAQRTGIPITLSLLYMEIARRLAKPVSGIGAPGHFLIRYDDGQVAALIDPFNRGRLVAREQLAVDDNVLVPVSNRLMLIRMLRNLEGCYVRANRFDKALAVTELLGLAGIQPFRPPQTSN